MNRLPKMKLLVCLLPFALSAMAQTVTPPSNPAANQSRPTPVLIPRESLLIGPGDSVHVQVFDTPELDETTRVSDAGDISLILGGSIHVAQLTTNEAADRVQQALKRAQVMYEPKVLVSVVQYATQNISVFGQVMKPGSYSIDTARSVIDVLSLAGGFTDLADRHVVVERHGDHKQVLCYVANNPTETSPLHPFEGAAADTLVFPGDRIFVPKAGVVYVLGDVGRAGGFPMTDNQSSLTVLQVLALAGGTTPSAVPNDSRLIRRKREGGYEEIPLKLSSMQKGKQPDIALQASDILYVPFSYIRNAALGLTGLVSSTAGALIYTK